MPLLEMPKSQRVWRKVRWPVFVGIVLVLLAVIGLVTRGLVVASTIEKTIKDAEVLESGGTIEQSDGAEKTLKALFDKYPGEETARAAWVWQTVLQALLWGKPLSSEATEVVAGLHADNEEFHIAARAGAALVDGRPKDAMDILETNIKGPRIAFVKAVSMSALGSRDKAREQLTDALSKYPTYIPTAAAAAEEALADNDRMEVLKMSGLLLKASPAHLLGDMLMVRLALPEWGEPFPDKEQIASLEQKLKVLLPRIASAPPKPAALGHYLAGRIALIAGRTQDAMTSFQRVLEKKLDADTVAYLAEAARTAGGAEAALSVLDKYENVNGPEMMDIRAQCLLEYHRVDHAEVAIEALQKSGRFSNRVKSLTWMLAVRKGDLQTALKEMPKPIGPEDKWLALEMYFQLAAAGNEAGVEALASALETDWSTCSQVIRSWHSKSLNRAMQQFANERLDCATSLMPRLMRKHVAASTLAQAAAAVHKENGGNLIFEVDRALAVWMNEGFDAAVRILDGIVAQKPEGVPLLERLGRAYLEMGLPKKVTALLKDATHPELLALRIFALEMENKTQEAAKLAETAVDMAKRSTHPALQYFVLRQKLTDDSAAVRVWLETNAVNTMGQWTSELADIGARALWVGEDRNESEKFLQRIARQTLVPGGAGESLDTFMVQVEQNMPRGGKYKNHALVVIRTLMIESAKDPRMAYWLAVENITNGSERVGLRLLADIPVLDPTFKPYYKRLTTMERLDEAQAEVMKKVLPNFKPEL
jgi:tetratricopeptide (TPR) repeat protein